MGRRPVAGRDTKIRQGHQRDAFFAKMRRRGGVPRVANQVPEMPPAVVEEIEVAPNEGLDIPAGGSEPDAASVEGQAEDVEAEAR